MIAITVFTMDGHVLRTVTCPPDHADAQAQSGELWMVGVAPPGTYIANPTTSPEAVPFPSQPSALHVWDYPSAQWVLPAGALDQAKAARMADLDGACRADIYAGFDSDALGASHHYPANDRDQQNLAASVLASILPGLPDGWTTPFWCADAGGNWAYVPHSAAQIQQVGIQAKAAVVAALEKNAGLQAQVRAAGTIAAVEAIIWG